VLGRSQTLLAVGPHTGRGGSRRRPSSPAREARNVARDAAAAARQHPILDAPHFGKFIGKPNAGNRQDEAVCQPERMNEPAMALILVVLAGPQRLAQSYRPLRPHLASSIELMTTQRPKTAEVASCSSAFGADPVWRGRNKITRPVSGGRRRLDLILKSPTSGRGLPPHRPGWRDRSLGAFSARLVCVQQKRAAANSATQGGRNCQRISASVTMGLSGICEDCRILPPSNDGAADRCVRIQVQGVRRLINLKAFHGYATQNRR
jgi:hypothetical protein